MNTLEVAALIFCTVICVIVAIGWIARRSI
jgi:hypothetical protein